MHCFFIKEEFDFESIRTRL